ncbi:hypothetical protein ACFFKU_12600 [Kineococcus gynurae]|uniref:Uncharacterized protein n=1 Tax=Kineococcus gynurae TaxID=452979 RepID=A0ABV5LQN3_9ACTN
MAAVTVLTRRFWPAGTWAVASGAPVLAVLTVWALGDMLRSGSSTAVLLLVFLPFLQWLLAGVVTALAAGTQALAARRRPA